MVDRAEVEKFWERHVGSRHMSWKDEIRILNNHRLSGKVPFKQLCAMYVTTKYWADVRKYILKRDRFKCVQCGSKVDLHVDHIRYSKTFGDEKEENLQTLCLLCHTEKTQKFDLRSSAKASKLRPNGGEELYEMVRRK